MPPVLRRQAALPRWPGAEAVRNHRPLQTTHRQHQSSETTTSRPQINHSSFGTPCSCSWSFQDASGSSASLRSQTQVFGLQFWSKFFKGRSQGSFDGHTSFQGLSCSFYDLPRLRNGHGFGPVVIASEWGHGRTSSVRGRRRSYKCVRCDGFFDDEERYPDRHRPIPSSTWNVSCFEEEGRELEAVNHIDRRRCVFFFLHYLVFSCAFEMPELGQNFY